MNAKERFYSGMAAHTISQITSSRNQWTSFLTTIGRNYGFTYPEQIMIHAQRPEATLCKEYDSWLNEKNRYVKRGSKGIALFVTDRDKPYLRYVFDVSDTGTRRNSLALDELWKIEEQHREPIQKAMENAFGVKAEGTMEMQLEEVANQLAIEYWQDNKKSILDIIANSYLEGYDEYNIEVAFRRAVATSITYSMYSRCTDDPDAYFEQEDFFNVFDFNTRQTVNALGNAVSSIAGRMFKEIEITIQEYNRSQQIERSQDHDERNDLHAGGRSADSRPETGTPRHEAPGQVRQDAQSVPAGEQSDPVQRPDSDGAVVPPSSGDRRDSEPQSGTANERVSSEEPGTGQGDKSDGLGTAHEQPESTGRGSSDDGAYQQLSLNLFLTEDEQIKLIDEAESRQFSAFSFAQEEIDHFLMLGSNRTNSRMAIATEFMKQKSVDELAQFLKETYNGGYGIKENGRSISAWYAEDGIHLAMGRSARYTKTAQVIPWTEAAERIGQLLEEGKFASNVELAEAPQHERNQLAVSLWYLYRDLSEKGREGNYLNILHRDKFSGFPDETAQLTEQLTDPQFRSILTQQFTEFLDVYKQDHSVMRFNFHKFDRIMAQLEDLELPRREYQTEMMDMPVVGYFITDDEINAELASGSNFEGSKARIYEYFLEPHSQKEKADFLKNEYGTGGRSHALSGSDHSSQDHDAKGLRYKKSGCEEVKLSWTQVAARVDDLVKLDRYLSPEAMAQRQAILDAKMELDSTLERAKELIDDFCQDEYDSPADFEDLSKIGIGYTTVTDDEIPIQVYVNLEDFRIERYLDGTLIDSRQYDSLQALIENELEDLDFSDLIDVTDEQVAMVQQKEQGWHYQVGDTVYLDDTAFLVEKITDREVQLRDPTLLYPIFRAENREQFERLLNDDERNHSLRGIAEVPGQPVAAEIKSSSEITQEHRYLVVAYHHIENGFDEKLDYHTLEEAEKAAQGYVDGTMEPDGFRFDGAAVYDQQERKYLRIYGDYPDEKAHAEVDVPNFDANSVEVVPEHFIDHFYVVEDIQKRGALDIKEYGSFEDAMRAYRELPSTQMKALGAMNTRRPLPGSLDLIHCKDGQDTIVQDYTKVAGWENPEVQEIISRIETALQEKEVQPEIHAENYRIMDDNLGEGSPRLKYARNVAAIRTLFQLEAEGRDATPQEQEILSNYVGWGGLADVFDPNKDSWTEEYKNLKGLLSDEEYAAARASTLNAHYTSPTVIRGIYDAVERMGFETGNILEIIMQSMIQCQGKIKKYAFAV